MQVVPSIENSVKLSDGASAGIDDLRALMNAVNAAGEELAVTHRSLEREVARLRAELAEANVRLERNAALAALGEVAAGIAHEIRNPLGAIRLSAQMLREDLRADEAAGVLLQRIESGVMDLDAVVHDVLRFARGMQVERKSVSIELLVERAMESCGVLIAESGTAVELRMPLVAECVDGDERLLVQALANVLRNAIEAMVESGGDERRVRIVAERVQSSSDRHHLQGEVIRVCVDDTGPGIAPDVASQVFRPFQTGRPGGHGLGLALVSRITEAHGGRVSAATASAGGARIILDLPAAAQGVRSEVVR